MAKYLLKASDEEFDSWRAAKPEGVSLAAWIRGALNAAARDAGREARRSGFGSTEALSVVVRGERVSVERATGLVPVAAPAKAFRPDPRPVSSKKGRR